MRSCVFAGTFDPVTAGHYETVKRCLEIFDEVYVGLLVNPDKTCFFTEEERFGFLKKAFAAFPAVKTRVFHGLLVDFMRETGASAYVRGVRDERDFCYEMENYRRSLTMDPGLFTLFVPAAGGLEAVSSTRVKRGLKQVEDVSQYLPAAVREDVIKAYRARERES